MRAAVLTSSTSQQLEKHQLEPLLPQADTGTLWRVKAAAPSLWDQPKLTSRWPRVPGNVALLEHPETGQLQLCSGFLPCGDCPPCQSGLHLACVRPLRPGYSTPGAFASHLWLPQGSGAWLAPVATLLYRDADADGAPLLASDSHITQLLALIAAAGPCYQAQALAGMVPGDTVLVLGSPGPGLLPLRLLATLGLRPIWIDEGSPVSPLPSGISQRATAPAREEIPSPACHLLLFGGASERLEQTAELWPLCLSCTFVGPERPRLAASSGQRLLAGELALRWVADLHPHLALDLAALVCSAQCSLLDAIQRCSWDELPAGYSAFCQQQSETWPVLLG